MSNILVSIIIINMEISSKRFDKALFFNNLFKYIHYVEENAQIIIPNNKDLFRKFKYKPSNILQI